MKFPLAASLRHAFDLTSARARVSDADTEDLDDASATTEIAPDLLRDVILPQRLLGSADCLDIYQHMFVARVEAIVAQRLPAVRDALGDECLAELVRDYLFTWPAETHDLSKVGGSFPEYLGATARLDAERRGWLSELARLERAIARAGDSLPETPVIPASLATNASPIRPGSVLDQPLTTVASLELLRFDHRVDELYESWLHGEEPVAPRRRPLWIAVLRQGSQVQRAPLTRHAWLLLAGLRDGRTVEDALRERFSPSARAGVRRRAERWIQAWAANGFFGGTAGN